MPLLNLSFGNLTQPLGSSTNSFPSQPSSPYSFGNLMQPMGNAVSPFNSMMGSSPANTAFNSNPVGSMQTMGVTPQDTLRRQMLLQQLQQQNANLQPTQYYTSPQRQITPPQQGPQYSPWQDYSPGGSESRSDWAARMIANQKAAGVYRNQQTNYTPDQQNAYKQQLQNAGVLLNGNFQDVYNSRIQHGLPGYIDPMTPTLSYANQQKYGPKVQLWNLNPPQLG